MEMMTMKQQKKKKGRSVQELLGIKTFTKYGLSTNKGELLFYDRGSYQAAQGYLDSAEKLARKDNYLKSIIDTYRECVAREAK